MTLVALMILHFFGTELFWSENLVQLVRKQFVDVQLVVLGLNHRLAKTVFAGNCQFPPPCPFISANVLVQMSRSCQCTGSDVKKLPMYWFRCQEEGCE